MLEISVNIFIASFPPQKLINRLQSHVDIQRDEWEKKKKSQKERQNNLLVKEQS